MAHQVRVHYQKNMIYRGAWLFWRYNLLKPFLMVLLCLLVGLFLYFPLAYRNALSMSLLILALVAVSVYTLSYYLYVQRSKKLFEKLETPEALWRLSEDHFATESNIGKSELKWNMIKKIIRSDRGNLWLIVYQNSSYSLFPTSGVDSAAQQYLIEKVQAHGGKILGG